MEFLQQPASPLMQQQKINHSIILGTPLNKQQETGIFHQNHMLEVVHNFLEIMREANLMTQLMEEVRNRGMVVVTTVTEMGDPATQLRLLTPCCHTIKIMGYKQDLVHPVIRHHPRRHHHRRYIHLKRI